MKLVCFSQGGPLMPGALGGEEVVSLDDLVPHAETAQGRMLALIDGFDALRDRVQARIDSGERVARSTVVFVIVVSISSLRFIRR